MNRNATTDEATRLQPAAPRPTQGSKKNFKSSGSVAVDLAAQRLELAGVAVQHNRFYLTTDERDAPLIATLEGFRSNPRALAAQVARFL
jgi:hypothetical protein